VKEPVQQVQFAEASAIIAFNPIFQRFDIHKVGKCGWKPQTWVIDS